MHSNHFLYVFFLFLTSLSLTLAFASPEPTPASSSSRTLDVPPILPTLAARQEQEQPPSEGQPGGEPQRTRTRFRTRESINFRTTLDSNEPSIRTIASIQAFVPSISRLQANPQPTDGADGQNDRVAAGNAGRFQSGAGRAVGLKMGLMSVGVGAVAMAVAVL